MTLTLSEPSLLTIAAPDGSGDIGGSQLWYADKWQRLSGCGPTAAANLMWYLAGSKPALKGLRPVDGTGRESFLALMQRLFECITPGPQGVNTAALFVTGALAYARAQGVFLEARTLEFSKFPRPKPSEESMKTFLTAALTDDLPVAFLNLSNGSLGNLESWHWVTLISFDPDTLCAGACDQGKMLELDLAAWRKTSVLGGAMVALTGAAVPAADEEK